MSAGILSGVRVLDFTRIFAGPLATQILGDLGADVIKVERAGGDNARLYGLQDANDVSGAFVAYNRNKRSIVLELKSQADRDVAQRLASRSDVVVENFRAGVMDAWNLDYDSVSATNPRVIYCSISGFGRVGPLARKAANDGIIQAYAGLMAITGFPGQPPVRCPASVADLSAGIYGALAILGALFHRERTGVGQKVETSLLGALMSLMGHIFADYWLRGHEPERQGSGVQLGVPNQAFPTKDGWIVIAAVSDSMWVRCCHALNMQHFIHDERFATIDARYRHRDELVEGMSAITATLSTEFCIAALTDSEVSWSPVRNVSEAAADPLLSAIGAAIQVPFQGHADSTVVGIPLQYSRTPTSVRLGAPALGEHTEEILEELGYSPKEIARLVEGKSVPQVNPGRTGDGIATSE